MYLDERKVQKLMQPRSLGNPTPAHGPCSVASASAVSGPPRSMERTSVSLVSADPLSNARASIGHGVLHCDHTDVTARETSPSSESLKSDQSLVA